MTDDPEITDPRDPMKRRDIVAELDRWLVSRASLREATVSHALLQGARDEIVALREQLGAVKGIAGNERRLSEVIIQQARDEALEEAARMCDRVPGDPRHGDFFAKAIRALKEAAR